MDIYTDGGSRGNPGKSACAFVVYVNGREIYFESKFLGINTNNFAEYSGVKHALIWLSDTVDTLTQNNEVINFYSDSELMVKQLNGKYRVKNETLKKFITEIQMIVLKNNLKSKFNHIPREKNKRADELVNNALDKNNET